MKLHVTLDLAEATHFAAIGIASEVDQFPVTKYDVTAEIKPEPIKPEYNIRANPEVGKANIIYLIKMMRCAMASANGAQWLAADTRVWIEEYINNPDKH